MGELEPQNQKPGPVPHREQLCCLIITGVVGTFPLLEE